MAHPNGGMGNTFATTCNFAQAYAAVGASIQFPSTTGEIITAKPGMADDGLTKTIVFVGERNRHGSVCPHCWGFRNACTQTRIGHCDEALDRFLNQPT